jgi:isopentenyl-diphosphate delta-isomerase
MPDSSLIANRKDEHIRINLEEDVASGLSNGLEHYSFDHCALPEMDLEDVDTRLTVFGRHLSAPLMISSMTGGTSQAGVINTRLAEAAQEVGVAMGVGSQRTAIEDPAQKASFQVRRAAPDVLLFANLGAVQLNYGYSIDHCRKAVEMIEADGLLLHLNPLQEALQPEGNTRFSGLLKKIEAVCHGLSVPVIIKEVGWGISEKVARQLTEAGVAAIDVAGAGGTSWSQVEKFRAGDTYGAEMADDFIDWGIPTAAAIQNVRRAAPHVIVFASGGLRNGVDITKCISLGATLGGMAAPFLKAAAISGDDALALTRAVCREIKIAMFVTGARNIEALQKIPLIYRA